MTQTEEIRRHLEAGHAITPILALDLFGCFRLGARIWDLKKAGLRISKTMVQNEFRGSMYASYRLATEQGECPTSPQLPCREAGPAG